MLFAALVVAGLSERYVPAQPGGVLRAPRPATAAPAHLARHGGIRLQPKEEVWTASRASEEAVAAAYAAVEDDTEEAVEEESLEEAEEEAVLEEAVEEAVLQDAEAEAEEESGGMFKNPFGGFKNPFAQEESAPSAVAAGEDDEEEAVQEELLEAANAVMGLEEADLEELLAAADAVMEEAEEEAVLEEAEEEEEDEKDAAPSIEDASEEDVAAAVEAMEAASEAAARPEPERLSASAEASLAAALISALAVLGIDLASFGVIENLDAAVAVGAIALSQVDSAGPVGQTLRAVGNTASAVVTKGIVPAAKAVNDFAEKYEVGLTARALLEIGLEKLILKAREVADPEAARMRIEEEKAAKAARKEAEERAARQEARDALPFWDLEKYKSD